MVDTFESVVSARKQKEQAKRLLSQDPSRQAALSKSLFKPLSVGIVLAQCPGGTLVTTETLSPSAMTMATLKSLGSPWPRW